MDTWARRRNLDDVTKGRGENGQLMLQPGGHISGTTADRVNIASYCQQSLTDAASTAQFVSQWRHSVV